VLCRWYNHLDPTINKGPWSSEEDAILLKAVEELGTRWTLVARRLQGRSENSAKNRWNSLHRSYRSRDRHRGSPGSTGAGARVPSAVVEGAEAEIGGVVATCAAKPVRRAGGGGSRGRGSVRWRRRCGEDSDDGDSQDFDDDAFRRELLAANQLRRRGTRSRPMRNGTDDGLPGDDVARDERDERGEHQPLATPQPLGRSARLEEEEEEAEEEEEDMERSSRGVNRMRLSTQLPPRPSPHGALHALVAATEGERTARGIWWSTGCGNGREGERGVGGGVGAAPSVRRLASLRLRRPATDGSASPAMNTPMAAASLVRLAEVPQAALEGEKEDEFDVRVSSPLVRSTLRVRGQAPVIRIDEEGGVSEGRSSAMLASTTSRASTAVLSPGDCSVEDSHGPAGFAVTDALMHVAGLGLAVQVGVVTTPVRMQQTPRRVASGTPTNGTCGSAAAMPIVMDTPSTVERYLEMQRRMGFGFHAEPAGKRTRTEQPRTTPPRHG